MRLTNEQKQANLQTRREARKLAKREAIIEAEKAQKPVKSITITIEWKRSQMWGNNPNAEAAIEFQDGTFERKNGYKASGCGYDKESTVIGQIFNEFMKYKLWNLPFERFANSLPTETIDPLPYGMHAYSADSRSYGQGVGTNCYYRIAEAIGGKFENIASGKAFDVYKYTETEK